jgi:predicted CxxxxCH...CXXCH cytochrome family protein
MSSIKPSHVLFSALLTLALGGCGDRNDKAIVPEGGHPSGWIAAHKTSAQTNAESCTECHGADLSGGIAGVGVACTKCHVNAPVGANAAGCTSCHGNPPDSGSFPNRNFSHAAHANITDVTCATCHNGFGSGTPDHGTLTSARISIDPLFQAKQAASAPTYSRNAAGVTCTNISCHGGNINPPVWGETLGCISCHAQGTAKSLPEYNSYYSGYSVVGLSDALGTTLGATLGTNQHARHLSRGAVCQDCHSTLKLTNPQHFGKLAAKDFVFPGNTIGNNNGGGGTKIGSYDPDPTAQTCSIVSCHGDTSTSTIKWPWYRLN